MNNNDTTLISCEDTQILLMKKGEKKKPTELKEFSGDCLYLVLNEDGTAIAREATTLLISAIM